jgi:hypothetical protein
MDNKSNEIRLSKIYQGVQNTDNIVLPSGMTVPDIKEYVEMMIKDSQPRHLRKEDRPSHELSAYKIPTNYFVVESNTVNFNSTGGSIFLEEEEEENEIVENEEEDMVVMQEPGKRKQVIRKSSFTSTIPIHFRTNDYGTMICLYIFNHGRKTIDEMIHELIGIEKHLVTILINKMLGDGYLRRYVDKEKNEETGEEEEIETLELVENEKKELLLENRE